MVIIFYLLSLFNFFLFCYILTNICREFRILVLVCYRNYRYPGCTTRTSVPFATQLIKNVSKVLYKKKQCKINKKGLPVTARALQKARHTPKLEKKTKKKN